MKRVIVSGYFNPLHGGHLNLIEAAAELGDYLIVIVNNDVQQMMKKGKIILDETNRVRLMKALRIVDEVVLSIDTNDTSQTETLPTITAKYPDDEFVFANGGDRSSLGTLPGPEGEACERLGITCVFGVGDTDKFDSSTRINKATGHED